MGEKRTIIEYNKIYESERRTESISHEDFEYTADFDYLEVTKEIFDFLSSKNWCQYLNTKKDDFNSDIVNKIYEECYNLFSDKVDDVQLFYVITEFYKVDERKFFCKLFKKYRVQLSKSLAERTGNKVHMVEESTSFNNLTRIHKTEAYTNSNNDLY